jgi:hypothetical protein
MEVVSRNLTGGTGENYEEPLSVMIANVPAPPEYKFGSLPLDQPVR